MRALARLSLLLALSLIACQSPAAKLNGKWEEVRKNGTVTNTVLDFMSDGSFAISAEQVLQPTMHLSGRWTVLDDGRVKIELAGPFGGTIPFGMAHFDGRTLRVVSRAGTDLGSFRRKR